jgi:O-antigen/teichoic acid export membrane protein
MSRYVSFSWPLVLAGAAGIVTAQGSIITANAHLGIEAVGAITLAAAVSQFSDRLDQIVTGTIYPAICAVADRTALLHESFVKSNRLGLMWAVRSAWGSRCLRATSCISGSAIAGRRRSCCCSGSA